MPRILSPEEAIFPRTLLLWQHHGVGLTKANLIKWEYHTGNSSRNVGTETNDGTSTAMPTLVMQCPLLKTPCSRDDRTEMREIMAINNLKTRHRQTAMATVPFKKMGFVWLINLIFKIVCRDLPQPDVLLLLPDPFRGIGAWRKTMKSQIDRESPKSELRKEFADEQCRMRSEMSAGAA